MYIFVYVHSTPNYSVLTYLTLRQLLLYAEYTLMIFKNIGANHTCKIGNATSSALEDTFFPDTERIYPERIRDGPRTSNTDRNDAECILSLILLPQTLIHVSASETPSGEKLFYM